ncbi:MAG: DNA polymerase III subunit gamma/tau [Phycisphaerales bacterium]|nr:MAG: DNA polymerase III subunit gamma/tau [Phycisphaerales bacterium]
MAYTVLARKYRSQTFDEVVGQDPIAKTLKNAIKTGRVAHAYLFAGTRGVGKTTMARVLAKALNCLSVDAPTTDPCCKCDSCVAISAGEDIDVVEIDGASNRGIDEVRELRQNAIYRPARCRFKIYIIDEVHMLTVPAFNALLKTLEEPPSHVKFIFATTEPNKVIATIQSRCQRFDFSNISPASIAEQLRFILGQEKIEYEPDLVVPLARMANGSMRDGLSLLDRLISTGVQPLSCDLLEEYLGRPDSEKIHTLIGQIGDSKAAETLAATEDLIRSGLGEVQIADALIECMRDLMVIKSAGCDTDLLMLTEQQRKRAGELAEKFDTAALIYNITALEKLRWALRNSDTPRALLDASVLRFALSEHFLNIDELVARLQAGSGTTVKKKDLTAANSRSDAETQGRERTESHSARGQAADAESQPASPEPPAPSELSDIESIRSNWQRILEIIGARLGSGTAALLKGASPKRFEDGQLTLEFDASAQIQKQMCESNGRAEQIQSLLSEHSGSPIRIRFQVASQEQKQAQTPTERPDRDGFVARRTSTQRKNEIVSDPAVREVLLGLNATVTGIEEDPAD